MLKMGRSGGFSVGFSLFLSILFLGSGLAFADESQLMAEIAQLRTEMKENTARLLRAQTLLLEMAAKVEKKRVLDNTLSGINDGLKNSKQLLDDAINTKTNKKLPELADAGCEVTLAGVQTNIDKFTKDIEEWVVSKEETAGEIILVDLELSKLKLALTQIESDIRTR